MTQTSLSTRIRKRLCSFDRQLASPFSDSRRRRFVHDMITALVLANHVHLSKIAPAAGNGCENIHSVEKRLSTPLGSEYWDASPLAGELLWLVSWAFAWLDLWGEDRYRLWCEALLGHDWRLPKKLVYLFDGIARLIQDLLHP